MCGRARPRLPRLSSTKKKPKIVRWIFEQYANGFGIQHITRLLEEQRVPTKKGKKLWYGKSVR